MVGTLPQQLLQISHSWETPHVHETWQIPSLPHTPNALQPKLPGGSTNTLPTRSKLIMPCLRIRRRNLRTRSDKLPRPRNSATDSLPRTVLCLSRQPTLVLLRGYSTLRSFYFTFSYKFS